MCDAVARAQCVLAQVEHFAALERLDIPTRVLRALIAHHQVYSLDPINNTLIDVLPQGAPLQLASPRSASPRPLALERVSLPGLKHRVIMHSLLNASRRRFATSLCRRSPSPGVCPHPIRPRCRRRRVPARSPRQPAPHREHRPVCWAARSPEGSLTRINAFRPSAHLPNRCRFLRVATRGPKPQRPPSTTRVPDASCCCLLTCKFFFAVAFVLGA